MPRPAPVGSPVARGLRLLMLAAACATAAPASRAADDAGPTPADLARLAPRISHSDADLQKLDLAVTFDMPVYGVNFRVRYLATGRDTAAVYIIDPADGTPIMATAEGVTLIYDPQSSSVMYVHTARPSFDLLFDRGTVRWNFGFGQFDALAGEEPWKLQLDAASFIEAAAAERAVRPLDGGAHEFTGATEKGGRVVARFAPSRTSPLVSLHYTPPLAQAPTMTLDRLLVNTDVGETIRSLPTLEELRDEFDNVIDLDWTEGAPAAPGHGVNAAARDRKRTLVLERLFKALIFRNAIHHESLRPAAEQSFGNVDWTAYEKRDRLNAEKLKRLITVPGIHAPG